MERIVLRPDSAYGILVESSDRLPYQIVRPTGEGFRTPQEAETILKEIRTSRASSATPGARSEWCTALRRSGIVMNP